MAAPRTDWYERNLDALRAFQPKVAAAVEATRIPPSVTSAIGRDGHPTFLIQCEDGRSQWFGGSSMPTISAPELVSAFESDGRNVVLPGVQTGLEPLLVAAMMPSHAALFVLEPDVRAVKLALELYDYAGLIELGRLVFLLGEVDELVGRFGQFFEKHPGYEVPAHLLPLAGLTSADVTALRAHIERAGTAIGLVHTRATQSSVERLAARPPCPCPAAPRVAVLGVDARAVSFEQARRVARALDRLGWSYELCIPDAPNRCHTVARLRAIEAVSADLVLLINGTPGPLSALLPPGLPVVSWFLPGAVAATASAEVPADDRLILAGSARLRDELACAGVPAGAIDLCDAAADVTLFRPPAAPPGAEDRRDLALVMDVPDDRPEAAGVHLTSQQKLWEALREVVRAELDAYREDRAEAFLTRAERLTGTVLNEPGVREQFVGLLRARIAPAALARSAAEALISAGYRLILCGRNWPAHGGAELCAPDGVPAGASLGKLFNKVVGVVLLELSAGSVQMGLDALSAGCHVLCYRGDGSFTEQFPGLRDVAAHLNLYGSSAELLSRVRSLVDPGAIDSPRPAAGRELVETKHSMADRLRSIVARVRQRQASVAVVA